MSDVIALGSLLSRQVFAVLVVTSAALPMTARGDDTRLALESVTVTGIADAPPRELTRTVLETGRPVSVLTSQAIEQIASPVADFGNLANLTPSFASSAPNGTGFDAAKNMTLRGFPDGQFNVTLDGIPIADPDGFSHHSTSIFPASSIQQMNVDRSPGGGNSLGFATIGGSVNVESLAIPEATEARLYGAYGSFATSLVGARLNTARPAEDGQTGLLVNLQHMRSSGAMSNADGQRSDLLLKTESRFAGGMNLTLLYSYDDYHFKNPASVSTAQIDQFGSGFGFTDTPGTPAYAGYAKTDRHADFGYARLRAGLADDWKLVETLYTYAYANSGLSLKGDLTASPVGSGFGVPASDIAGRLSDNRYRTVGNTLQLERATAIGTLRTGLWLEHSRQHSQRNALDLTTGAPYDINKAAASPTLFDYDSQLDTVQPYADYEWHASSALEVRGGLRWQHVRRGFDAVVVPNSLPGTNGQVGRTVTSLLPSLEANYAFTPSTHGYVQAARGALVPNQSFFYTASPSQGNQARPETAQALQVGVVHAAGPVRVTVDAYLIDLKDYVSTVVLNGTTQYVNSGKVRYRGIEAEGSADLGAGFSAVANASVIKGQYRNAGIVASAQQAGDTIPLVPSYTALAGLLFGGGGWSGSVLTKFLGSEYQGRNGSSDGDNYRVAAWHYTNLTVGRNLSELLGLRHASLSLQVNNLENRTPVTDIGGPSIAGPLLVNVLARRNYTVVLRCDI